MEENFAAALNYDAFQQTCSDCRRHFQCTSFVLSICQVQPLYAPAPLCALQNGLQCPLEAQRISTPQRFLCFKWWGYTLVELLRPLDRSIMQNQHTHTHVQSGSSTNSPPAPAAGLQQAKEACRCRLRSFRRNAGKLRDRGWMSASRNDDPAGPGSRTELRSRDLLEPLEQCFQSLDVERLSELLH